MLWRLSHCLDGGHECRGMPVCAAAAVLRGGPGGSQPRVQQEAAIPSYHGASGCGSDSGPHCDVLGVWAAAVPQSLGVDGCNGTVRLYIFGNLHHHTAIHCAIHESFLGGLIFAAGVGFCGINVRSVER